MLQDKEAIVMMKMFALCSLLLVPTVLMAYPPVGSPAPDVTVQDTAGVDHNIISENRGHVIQLFFWQSTWSGCLAELPRIQAMYDDYKPRGFVALAINLWQSMDIVKQYARQYRYFFFRDGGAAWNLYNINNGIPLNYVVDTAGIVRYGSTGFY